jgi:hypothetical protein
MIVVPFKASAYHGFADVHGLLRWADPSLDVEFEIADSITGLVKQNVKMKFAPRQIDQVEHVAGWFGHKIRVRVREMTAIDNIPWREGPEFVVSVARRDRDVAAQFAEEVTWALE